MQLGGEGVEASHPVWAVTSYFPFDDPVGVRRRLSLYREFRRHLQIPLATIELSLDGQFHLQPSDAEILLQVRGDLMFQKERLLNRIIQALPAHCDTVAWIDCDIVLPQENWARLARKQLEDSRLVQPFRRVHLLPPQTLPGAASPDSCDYWDSIAFRYCQGDLPETIHRTAGLGVKLRFAPGMVWVASRELLSSHSLYDAAILGAGDKILFSAACGYIEDCCLRYQMRGPRREHFHAWAEPFAEAVRARIAWLDIDAYHLWHGPLENRNYGNRYCGFEEFDFDPYRDITVNAGGAWNWSSDKPRLHQFVRTYFESRRADTNILTQTNRAAAAP